MTREALSRIGQKIIQLLPVVLLVCALVIVHNQLKVHDLSDILTSLQSMPMWAIGAAFVLMVINYLVLAGYDWLALRFTGHTQIPFTDSGKHGCLAWNINGYRAAALFNFTAAGRLRVTGFRCYSFSCRHVGLE